MSAWRAIEKVGYGMAKQGEAPANFISSQSRFYFVEGWGGPTEVPP